MHGPNIRRRIDSEPARCGTDSAQTQPAPQPTDRPAADPSATGTALPAALSIAVAAKLSDLPFWPGISEATPGHRFVFQCADVLAVLRDTIGAAQRVEPLFVAVTTKDGAPLLLLPLGIERRDGLRVLGFLDGTVSDFNAPIVFAPAQHWDGAAMRQLWNDLQPHLPAYDIAIFRKMPETIDGIANPFLHLATARSAHGTHTLKLPADWSAAARDILPDLSDSRRRLRKLDRLGATEFRIADNVDEAIAFTTAAMAMKGRRLVDTIGVDRFASEPGYADYYVEITRRLFATGAVHVSALMIDGTPRAAHWGFVFAGRFYHLLTAFDVDAAWRPYALGRMHNEFLMEWSANAGLATFDFGVGDEPYKTAYSNDYQHLADAILPRTLIGHAYGWLVDLRRYSARTIRASAFATTAERIRRDLNKWRNSSQQ
ncbi:GNAT family N-acetyltransferase [Rhodopseudomonas palustris]|nr:GNAT family N-acetyltransferase [Rhodopseudomonas palustris]